MQRYTKNGRMDSKERDLINSKQNKFLLQNWERLKAQENEVREPIKKKGKKVCPLIIETACRLYESGKMYKEIAALLGISISSAGRLIRHKDRRRKH